MQQENRRWKIKYWIY